jgi:hypothetical protein
MVKEYTVYTDDQLEDIKNVCCSGQSILGIDKTFNLCNMHVTATCFNQTAVNMASTKQPPIFLGYKSILSKNVLYKRFTDLLVNTFINQLLINVLPKMSSAQQVSRIWKGGGNSVK